MDMNELMQEHPDLYNQVVQQGVAQERQRMQALEEVCPQEEGELLMQAKYGDKPMTAEQLCVQLIAKQKVEAKMAAEADQKQKDAFLKGRSEETAEMKGVEQEAGADSPGKADEPTYYQQMTKKVLGLK